MPAYLRLFVRYIFTHIQFLYEIVTSVKINTTHSTLELVQRVYKEIFFFVILHEATKRKKTPISLFEVPF